MRDNDWKDRLGVMYFQRIPIFQYNTWRYGRGKIRCRRRKNKLCAHIHWITREPGREVWFTLITGFRGPFTEDLTAWGNSLKVKCGVGVSAKDGEIYHPGDLRAQGGWISPERGLFEKPYRSNPRSLCTIYRASAGAGKTHKLTGEYLMMLFPSRALYRRILGSGDVYE